MQHNTLIQNLSYALLFANTFLVSAVFRYREFGSNSIDFQILLKLGIAVISFGVSVLLYRIWIGRMLRIDNIFCVVMLIWFVLSSFYAPSLIYSLAAAFTFMSITFTMYMSASVLNTSQIIRTIIWACSALTVVSIIVYFINPNFGRMKEWSADGRHLPGYRLSGITGTANAIGYIAAFSSLLIVCYRIYIDKSMSLIYYALFLVNFGAQIMSHSRSSLAAALLALGLSLAFHKASHIRLSFLFIGFCVFVLALFVIDIEQILVSLSRSGDISEITTGTGRTNIWNETLIMISQSPIFGWGFASSGYYMPSFDHPSPHAHNMMLQILFTTGFIGFIFAFASISIKIYYTVKLKDPFKMTLMLFLLLQGITESSAFQGVASMATIVFALIMTTNYNDDNSDDFSDRRS